MLRALSPDSGAKVPDRNLLVRVIAQSNILSMRVNDVEAGCEAEVAEEGVCSFRYRKFLPSVRSYAKERRLTIVVTAKYPNWSYPHSCGALGNFAVP